LAEGNWLMSAPISWCGLTRPTRACCKAGNVARRRPRARSANTVGSASPPSTASSIARPLAPRTAVAIDANVRLADSRTVRRRLTSAARAATNVVHEHVNSAQVADGNRRHKAGASDTMAREIGDPCGVGHVWTCARTRSVRGKIVFDTQTRRKKNGSSHVTGSSHGPDLAKHACPQHLLPKRGACAIVGARGAPAPDDDVGGRPVAARVWHWFSACAWWTEGASDP